MALKRFTSCPAYAGMTDRLLLIDQFRYYEIFTSQ
jgi:hypothetical protein